MIAALALAALFARCAPNVGPRTMRALVTYESGNRPFAIDDNTTHRSYDPSDRKQAEALASALLRRGHIIDVGYVQLDSANWQAYGLGVADVFDPCTNIAAGALILRLDYTRAARLFGPGQVALAHALSLYNAGNAWSGLAYAHHVYGTAAMIANDATRRPTR